MLSFVYVQESDINNDNTNEKRFLNENQIKKKYCKLNKEMIIFSSRNNNKKKDKWKNSIHQK